MNHPEIKEGNLIKFVVLDARGRTLRKNLYIERERIWKQYRILPNKLGIIFKCLSLNEAIKDEYQQYYKGEQYRPYLWFCFETKQTYLVFKGELDKEFI